MLTLKLEDREQVFILYMKEPSIRKQDCTLLTDILFWQPELTVNNNTLFHVLISTGYNKYYSVILFLMCGF